MILFIANLTHVLVECQSRLPRWDGVRFKLINILFNPKYFERTAHERTQNLPPPQKDGPKGGEGQQILCLKKLEN